MKRIYIILLILLLIIPVTADTVILYADNAADLSQTSASADWSVLVAGVGSAATKNTANPYLIQTTAHATTNDKYIRVFRQVTVFTKPDLGAGYTIDSAKIRFKYYGKTATLLGSNEVALVVGNPADPAAPVAGDFNELTLSTASEIASRFDFTSAGSDINMTFNSLGLSNLSGSGPLPVYTLDGDELDGTFSGTWSASAVRALRSYNATSITTANRPYIEYTYSASGGDTTPPASITGLTNTTTNCNNITWSWANPTDADYYRLTYQVNSSANQTLSNTTTSLLVTGLPENTDITFSTLTEDLTGNFNLTWTNQTTKTNFCSATPTPTPTPTPTVTPTPVPTISGSLQIPQCGRQDLFFYNASSDIAGYRLIRNIPELDAQRQITSASFAVSDGEINLGMWIMDTGVAETKVIAPGSWDFRTYHIASSNAGTTSLKYRIFNQTSTGTKTWLFFGNAIIKDITRGTIPSEYEISYARRNYTVLYPGDRLGIQINVSTNSASARTVTMELAGNTNASMVSVANFLCPVTTATPTPTTIPPTWHPEINPSTDKKLEWSLNGILYFLFGG